MEVDEVDVHRVGRTNDDRQCAYRLRDDHDAHGYLDACHRYPDLAVDRDGVLFGAATHDVGKTLHPEELAGPGSAHEEAGRDLLLRRGFPPALARFAATHACWDDPAVTVEDLLVSTADKVWKDKRVPELEDRLVKALAAATRREPWEEYLALDDLLARLGADAGHRLAFQSAFPVHP
ncbi:HD domain-containing protein [Streptomyces sp. HUAS TT3]|uniref:HD domain-containing protein n=1 Tax=Streptomyces sp. HUAS TT3 TaxID=3447510 RepID=UPI003F659392